MSDVIPFVQRRGQGDRWQALADLAYQLDDEDACVRSVEVTCRAALEAFPEPKAAQCDFEGYAVNAFLTSLLQALNPIRNTNDTHPYVANVGGT